MTSTSHPAYADQLEQLVRDASTRLFHEPDERMSQAPAEGKWSPKQIIGHLIDSAANNHVRFVMAPQKDDLVFAGYDQEAWVATQRYQEASWDALVRLWESYNRQLAHVMKAIPADVRGRQIRVHNFDRIAWKTMPQTEPVSLDYLMEDYVGHLESHLKQIWAILEAE